MKGIVPLMKGLWRYLEQDRVFAAYGLAADEWLMRAYESPGQPAPPTLRLYTYRSHCALVGQFQDVETEIDLEYCRAERIPINRRPTGGGAIIMGDDQLGMALAASVKYPGIPGHPREIFALYSAAICRGLKTLGIHASMGGKNDIRVNGRKIAGLGLCRGERGALLFHASLLVGLDIPLMLRVLKIPLEKVADKLRADIEENLTTVRRELRKQIEVAEVRDIIRRGFEAAMGIKFEARALTPEEVERIRALELEKYSCDGWIFQQRSGQTKGGVSVQKTPGGLLRIHVTLAGDRIERIRVTGDFFAQAKHLVELEKIMSGLPASEDVVRRVIKQFFSERSNPIERVGKEELARAVLVALRQAKQTEDAQAPYGCFAAPVRG